MAAPEGNWAKVGDKLILADKLAERVLKAAKVERFEKRLAIVSRDLVGVQCAHPLRNAGLGGYQFDVPLLAGDHVTDEDGTGFVHTAPGHGREDFDIWMENAPKLQQRGIDTAIPFTVDGDGRFTKDAPGFEGKRVIDDKGNKGDANQAVIDALVKAGALIARGRLKHQYPHSWRSKKPVIFRNTPQWFIAMDKPLGVAADGTRAPSPLVGEGRGASSTPSSTRPTARSGRICARRERCSPRARTSSTATRIRGGRRRRSSTAARRSGSSPWTSRSSTCRR